MVLEILKSDWGEDDDDLNRNFIWLKLRVIHNKNSEDDEFLNILITLTFGGNERDFEIGFGDDFKLKERYYFTIDEDDFYYPPIIKLLETIDSELNIDFQYEYELFDSGNLIGFKVDVDDVVSNN